MPEHVPAAVAAPTSCATATVAAALAAGGPELEGRTVLVTGAGMLGLTAAAMASTAGAEVTLAEPDPDRRALARSFGATLSLDPDDVPAAGFDVALEMSGHPAAVEGCLHALDVAGTAVLVGSVFPDRAVALDPEAVVRGLHRIVGIHNYGPGHLTAARDFVAARHERFPFGDLVGGPFGLIDVDSAFAAAGRRVHAREAVRPD